MQDLETAKVEFYQCSIGKRARNAFKTVECFGMREVKAVVNAYPCDVGKAKKPNSIFFQLGREMAISERRQTDVRLGLVQIQVALDQSNGGEIFWMCALFNMTIYAMKMTKLEVNGNMVMLQPGSSQHFCEKDDFIMKYEFDQSSVKSLSMLSL